MFQVENLSVRYAEGDNVLRSVSLRVDRGERLGIIGESGCGKTTLVKSILRMLPRGARVLSGDIRYEGISLLSLGSREMLHIRGRKIAYMPQDVGTSLDSMCKVKTLFYDILRRRDDAEILRLLNSVNLPDGKAIMNSYPFELSGGMKQRVLLALSLCLKPGLLIADEPTSSIDAPLRKKILDELVSVSRKEDMGLIIITHNINDLRESTDRIAVMYRGEIVEQNGSEELFDSPKHDYTRHLLQRR